MLPSCGVLPRPLSLVPLLDVAGLAGPPAGVATSEHMLFKHGLPRICLCGRTGVRLLLWRLQGVGPSTERTLPFRLGPTHFGEIPVHGRDEWWMGVIPQSP